MQSIFVPSLPITLQLLTAAIRQEHDQHRGDHEKDGREPQRQPMLCSLASTPMVNGASSAAKRSAAVIGDPWPVPRTAVGNNSANKLPNALSNAAHVAAPTRASTISHSKFLAHAGEHPAHRRRRAEQKRRERQPPTVPFPRKAQTTGNQEKAPSCIGTITRSDCHRV